MLWTVWSKSKPSLVWRPSQACISALSVHVLQWKVFAKCMTSQSRIFAAFTALQPFSVAVDTGIKSHSLRLQSFGPSPSEPKLQVWGSFCRWCLCFFFVRWFSDRRFFSRRDITVVTSLRFMWPSCSVDSGVGRATLALPVKQNFSKCKNVNFGRWQNVCFTTAQLQLGGYL